MEAEFTVAKAEDAPQPIMVLSPSYILTYYKTVKDKDGNDVTIVDRTETVTKESLELELARLDERRKIVQTKLDSVNNIAKEG